MRTLGTLLRILLGFIVACVVAGLVTAAFIITPTDISSLAPDLRTERLNSAVTLGLLAATHSAIFAFVPAFLAIAYAEWRSMRSWLYYAVAGIIIALLGFGAEYLAEQGVVHPSIVNDYAARAFLTVGFLGGLAYWLVSGRLAGHAARPVGTSTPPEPAESEAEDDEEEDEEREEEKKAPAKSNPKVATAKR